MKWEKSFADDRCIGRLRWTVAWWLEGGNREPLRYNDEELYIIKLRGKKGYYLCTYSRVGADKETVEFGPFPTLRLAKMTYALVTSGTS